MKLLKPYGSQLIIILLNANKTQVQTRIVLHLPSALCLNDWQDPVSA